MSRYKLLIIDLDGTMYRGKQKIEEAPLFIQKLQEQGQAFIFLTNNSTKSPAEIVVHLASFGIEAQQEQIYTSAIATANYIRTQKEGASVYAIGESGLRSALAEAGCQLLTEVETEKCDYVVMGLDREITYQKLAQAALAVRAGASFISTNADKAFPSERGLLPGNGSLTAVVQIATNRAPLFIGKPEAFMIKLILQEKGIKKEEALMIGDNYDTDITAGIRAGIDTALVFTGYTSKEDLQRVSPKPTYQWETLLDYYN